MAVLSILHYPDQRLHTIAKPVAAVDARIVQIVADMGETNFGIILRTYTNIGIDLQPLLRLIKAE